MEMLVVLAVLSLLALAIPSMIGRPSTRLEGRQNYAKLDAALAKARTQAIRSGARQTVELADVIAEVDLTGSLKPELDAAKLIDFYADGSSSGGTVVVGARPLMTISWMTGAVDAPR